MRQQPIVDRLKPCGFAQTGGVLEWAALTNAPGRLPAAFVVPNAEAAGDNRNDHGIDQRVSSEFSVVLVLNGATRAPGALDEQLHELSVAVFAQLLGWKHPDASAPTLYAGGRMLSADGGSLAWALQFTTAYHLRTTR